MKAKLQQVRISLPKGLSDFLERKAEQEGVFKSTVASRAITLFKKVAKDMDEGAPVVLVDKDYWEALNQQFKDLF